MELFHSAAGFPLPINEITYRFNQTRMFCDPQSSFHERMHSHKGWEIYVHCGGRVAYSIGGEIYALEAGDVIVCRPGDLHNAVYEAATVHEYKCLWISVGPDSEQGRLLEGAMTRHKYTPDPQISRQIDAAFSALFESSPSEQRRLVLRIVALIQGSGAVKGTPLYGPPRQLKNVIAYIDENYCSIASMAELAENNYISLPTLNRLFKKYMGITPNDYLNLKRITRGRALLEEGLSVTDVAVQLGYSSCSYFIRLFKEQYGMTPYKYKNRLS